jgi:hypothetical protein
VNVTVSISWSIALSTTRRIRLHVIESKSGVDGAQGFLLVHDADRGILSVKDEPKTGPIGRWR